MIQCRELLIRIMRRDEFDQEYVCLIACVDGLRRLPHAGRGRRGSSSSMAGPRLTFAKPEQRRKRSSWGAHRLTLVTRRDAGEGGIDPIPRTA